MILSPVYSIYPLLANAPSKAARILVVAVAVLHTALVIMLWIGFFSVVSDLLLLRSIV